MALISYVTPALGICDTETMLYYICLTKYRLFFL
jgi:hypothetical protein